MKKRPGGQLTGAASTLTKSQLYPFLINSRDLMNQLNKKAYLVPVATTLLLVLLLFATIDRPAIFRELLGAYLVAAGLYFVYLLCGKRKPWWFLLSISLATGLLLAGGAFELFLSIFPDPEGSPFRMILVGLREELFKAVPLLGAFLLGRRLRSPWRERLGLWEPLDGILLGAASAAGFTFVETLGQYVHKIAETVSQQYGAGYGEYAGLALVIPRTLGEVTGHVAYSGFLGYFVGLAVLKPKRSWQILSIGYLFAAGMHAAWDQLAGSSLLVKLLIGGCAYVALAAAILKARQISPTRSANFATEIVNTLRSAPAGTLALHIGNQVVPLSYGTKLNEGDIPGLKARSFDGVIGEVNRNPQDPSILGLKNLSTMGWTARTAAGDVRQILAGQSIRLAAGTVIRFGRTQGQVE